MERKPLEQRAKELKDRLSVLGQAITLGKEWLKTYYNELKANKTKLYNLERERLQYDDIYNYQDVKLAEISIAITNLKRDIEFSKERVKEEENRQREIVYEFKKVNREYSKLEKRILKKQSKIYC